MKKEHDYVIFIGRFQPFHKGHLETLEEALKIGENVIVICGSADKARDIRNPFTAEERIKMISTAIPSKDQNRVTITSVRDYPYNDSLWISEIKSKVEGIILEDRSEYNNKPEIREAIQSKKLKVALTGHKKDHTSYYLEIFPGWDFIEQLELLVLNATDIRKSYFQNDTIIEKWLTPTVVEFLKAFKSEEMFTYLKKEFDFVDIHKDSWDSKAVRKYGGPILTTVDSVVTCMGHILLIKRKAHPGKGLLALPGGYLLHRERIEDGMIRELKEETRIKLAEKTLRMFIKDRQVFDDPERSVRGRIITHAFHIELPHQPDGKLPKIKGGDDAEKARWYPIEDFEIMHEELFEDHYYIGSHFLKLRG